MPGDLRGHRVPVGGECAGLDEDAGACALRAVKAREHQVQIHRERVHRHDFVRMGATQCREARGEILVIGHPRPPSLFVRLHRKARPLLELLVHPLAGRERLQPE